MVKILQAGRFQSFSPEAERQLDPLVQAMKITPKSDTKIAIGTVAHNLRHALSVCDSTQVATKVVTAVLNAYDQGLHDEASKHPPRWP